MGAIINRRREMGGRNLPYGAKKIEYLESSGTQWIDTGVVATATTTVKTRCSLTKEIEYSNLIGCDGGKGAYFFPIGNYKNGYARMIYGTDDQNGTYLFSYQLGTVLNIVFNDKKNCYIDGVLVKTLSAYFNSKSLNILAVGLNVINYSSHGRIYSLTIYSDGVDSVIFRDYIPVRVGQVGYLYDKVSGQLFGNAGTGAFILGPDV